MELPSTSGKVMGARVAARDILHSFRRGVEGFKGKTTARPKSTTEAGRHGAKRNMGFVDSGYGKSPSRRQMQMTQIEKNKTKF